MAGGAMRVLDSEAALGEGVAWLAAHDAGMARIAAMLPLPPLRRRPEGFATLLHAITGQQVSTASAAAIWARVEGAGLITPEAVLTAGEAGLRAVGLSRPKIRYALAIAASGTDFDALATLPDEDVISSLVALPGIGRWSAEIYATTALGRADILPAGDLALQEAARLLYRLDARPGELAFRAMGQAWSPWRGVAARMLWSFYRAEKNREGRA
ncbi:DNA-3-methyladenine glycosylase 2 family protein [Pseudooceanicola sediminis]|uniref:DNA-3-methyladenine glycosylase II n=1 Tax=Pseudooceanicola sediminis TaxID=2211117 RepID=A0A399J579_9RHOB|nr:DNA-3-methyladenine glycosylase [Pseudooceanicola sediminis]KAA2317384.1 DNA-3-methyladenine glycosylase 2 family protein [Puniceibacterium sp. HSS470]RII39737.1 DNA-3-methyladenine glycosylase 2 family protein [Pseudooceanicola sediminis]|tara:strand:- start:5656 stop:6294 length:639 start_codon:yes stop_codon:yes gene_type:complete